MAKRGGIVLIGFLLFLTLLGYFYIPFDPSQMDISRRFEPPSLEHFFGTDHFGRDILSRILVGARISLLWGFSAVLLGCLVGVCLGLWAGFRGSLFTEWAFQLSDALQAIPAILLALLFAAVTRPGVLVILWSIALGNVPLFFRLTRNQVRRIKLLPYVEASRALGASDLRIMFRHILPNLVSSLLVQFSLSLAGSILVEASLSYLGVGIQPPQPSWGGMLKEAQAYGGLAPWTVLIPGFFIVLTVLGFNSLGKRGHTL